MEINKLIKVALKIADSIDYSAPQTDDKSVLLRIRNLKQYFPVRGKRGLFVRACDGISMDIYEGETFGLVGESGCGKSTFGRTILQLYQQTYGKTLYYGRSLDSLAPAYLWYTVKKLPYLLKVFVKHYEQAEQLAVVSETVKKDPAASEAQRYRAMDQYAKAKKLAEDEFLAIAQVLGGLMISSDLGTIKKVYLPYQKIVEERNRLSAKLVKLRLKAERSNEKRNRFSAMLVKLRLKAKRSKAEKAAEAISALKNEISAKDEIIAEKYKDIEKLREAMQDDPDFRKLEAFRDNGIDLARLEYCEMRRLRRDLQIIFQDPYSSLNARLSVGQIIGEGLLAQDIFSHTGEKMFDYIKKVMEKCGLADYMVHRYPHQFSGGQRQRIGIARSLALNPKFVVCDEPVSALDVSIQSQILNLLSDLKQNEKLTYLFISHDMSVIKYICDRIGVMYLGNIVELARTEDIFRQPRHPYTDALLKAIPTTDLDKDKVEVILEGDIPSPIRPPSGCKFHTRCPLVTDICKELTPELREAAPGHYVACHHKLGEASA